MYGIALSVVACLRAGTKVDVAWIIATDDFPDRDPTDAIAITPGGGRIGSLLGGAVVDVPIGRARRATVTVNDVDALVAGLSHGGSVQVLVLPATELPAELWDLLIARQPVGIVAQLDGDDVVRTELTTVDGPAEPMVSGDTITTTFFPVPKLVVIGTGPIADALVRAATLVGWQTQVTNDPSTAAGLIAPLAPPDKLVVAAHDLELAGAALAAGLDSGVGYIGALGGRKMQQTRADWLAYRGITEIERIHGPAGLDIGADTPEKVALSIVAEAIAVEAGKIAPRTLDLDDSSVR
ncbi:MAG TPA: XdhC family protein [Acidimicrobiales bacterium]|nr:XdhC family protein [Acidimicrobiales bacterium]